MAELHPYGGRRDLSDAESYLHELLRMETRRYQEAIKPIISRLAAIRAMRVEPMIFNLIAEDAGFIANLTSVKKALEQAKDATKESSNG